MRDWTPKEIENAMLYGVCRFCCWPRETKTTLTSTSENEIVYSYSIECPNCQSGADTPSTGC